MNRRDKRAHGSYARKLARQPWTPLEEKHFTEAERERAPKGWGIFIGGWLNNNVSVQRFHRVVPIGDEDVTVEHLAVRRHDEQEIAGWDLLQNVKNELAGVDAQAIEVYPRADEVVDVAPMRHLFVVPADFMLPSIKADGE